MNPTGLKLRFRSLYRQSLPGSRINEDGLGLHGHYAWVIDGATGLSTEQLTSGGSDAAWLAGIIGDRLQELSALEWPPEEVLKRLEIDAGEAFETATAHLPGRHDHHAPSACLGLVRIQPDDKEGLALEGRILGDVVALVPSKQGVLRWTDERAKPFEKKTLAALGAHGHEPGRIPEAVRQQILENRGKLNRPDGYWVVSPRRSWTGSELRFAAPLSPGESVVLATDGFMRLVDVFDAYSDDSLHAALAAGRGDALMQELREMERSDLRAGAYPRVKTHDDATVLVIAAEPYD